MIEAAAASALREGEARARVPYRRLDRRVRRRASPARRPGVFGDGRLLAYP
jgi:hypothetical protein